MLAQILSQQPTANTESVAFGFVWVSGAGILPYGILEAELLL
jgi:hypothetical protein